MIVKNKEKDALSFLTSTVLDGLYIVTMSVK